MLAKAVARAAGRRPALRAQVGRLRCLVFRDGDELELASRNQRPLTRYFPELIEPLLSQLPARCVLDGELGRSHPDGPGLRSAGPTHPPAASRVDRLAVETPASFVAFDLLALDDRTCARCRSPHAGRARTAPERRATAPAPDPCLDRSRHRAGLVRAVRGVRVRRRDRQAPRRELCRGQTGPVQGEAPPQRRLRRGRVPAAQGRWRRFAPARLFDDGGPDGSAPRLHHVGVCSAFAASRRKALLGELARSRPGAAGTHPWVAQLAAAGAEVPEAGTDGAVRMPGGVSRWSSGRDSDWVPLRCEQVAEVTFENVTAWPVPSPCPVRALAARQDTGGLRLRPDRPATAGRVRRDLRRGGQQWRLTGTIDPLRRRPARSGRCRRVASWCRTAERHCRVGTDPGGLRRTAARPTRRAPRRAHPGRGARSVRALVVWQVRTILRSSFPGLRAVGRCS